ncbi:hypothetical protein AAUPMC_15525 [Pasteurella multocida subsp. multocida str. Anand1_cattle]|nr:hypothetical protein AAUPMC_15525 [Pasteurella multocida subsp. multocida str. Anand1_cattle]
MVQQHDEDRGKFSFTIPSIQSTIISTKHCILLGTPGVAFLQLLKKQKEKLHLK